MTWKKLSPQLTGRGPEQVSTISITVEARPGGGFNPDWLYYPACPAAELIATIAGTATLTDRVLHLLRDSKQYTINITHPTTVFGEANGSQV